MRLAIRTLAAVLVVLAGCTITLPEGVSCAGNAPCPEGQACDNGFCRFPRLGEARLPDSGFADAGPDAAVDSGKPDAESVCSPACSGDAPICDNGQCVSCMTGTRRCDGDTPVECSEAHHFSHMDACKEPTPVCNNGFCGKLRLRGGVSTVRPLTGATGSGVRLREHALTRTNAQCTQLRGQRVCLVGGIEP